MSILATLLELSRLSEEKAKIDPKEQLLPLYKEIRELEAARIAGKQQLAKKQRQLNALKEAQARLLAAVPDLERQVAEAREKLKSLRDLSLKEMLAIRQAGAQAQQKLALAEERQEEIRRLEAEYAVAREETRERLAGLKESYNQAARQYNQIKRSLDLQMAALLSREEGLLEKLDPESLAIYREAARRCPGSPVAFMEKGVCLGCRIGLSKETVKRAELGKGLVRCENCMRILISKTEDLGEV